MKATPLDEIFDRGGAASSRVCEVTSEAVTSSGGATAAPGGPPRTGGAGEAQVACQEVFDRLNLWFRVPIPSLGGDEQLALFLYADTAIGVDGAAKEPSEPWGSSTGLRTEPVKTKEWLKEVREANGVLDYVEEADQDPTAATYGLKVFSTRIFANLFSNT